MNKLLRPKIYLFYLCFFVGFIGIYGTYLLLLFLLNTHLFYLRVFWVILVFFSIIITIGAFLYPIVSQISINDTSIYYRNPFYSINCEWEDISGIEFTEERLFLLFNEDLLKEKNFLIRTSFKNEIPVSNFVKSHNKQKDWQNDEALCFLMKKIPLLKSVVETNIANQQ